MEKVLMFRSMIINIYIHLLTTEHVQEAEGLL